MPHITYKNVARMLVGRLGFTVISAGSYSIRYGLSLKDGRTLVVDFPHDHNLPLDPDRWERYTWPQYEYDLEIDDDAFWWKLESINT